MSKRDDYLEEKLNEWEMGSELRNFQLGEIDTGEEASLVSFAAAIHDLAHPEQDRETVQSEKRKIISVARNKYATKQTLRTLLNGRFKGQWLFVSSVAGAALILLMAFVLAAGVGMYFSGPRGAQAAALSDVAGVVEVSDTGLEGNWYSVSSGGSVQAGQRIRTGAESAVTLVFFEGTQATLGSNTDLVVNKLDGNWGNELQVELIQNKGETNHQVIPLQGDQASYDVLTPSGSASVRGTSFKVHVNDTGLSLFTVETGEVLVTNDGTETSVSAGQGVVTELGEPLDYPTYLFTLQGELQDNIGKTWVVEGIDIIIKDGTRIYGDPQESDIVLVNGHITKENEWVAHTIDIAFTDGKGGTFTGIVTSVGTDELEINGIKFIYGDDLPQVGEGDIVRVTFIITEKGWEVENLILLEDRHIPEEDEPELYFQYKKRKATTCEPKAGQARGFTNTLNYAKADSDVSSIDVLLDYAITEGDEFVARVVLSADGVDLAPDTIVTVKDGTPVTIKVRIILRQKFEKLPPEGEIKIRVVSKQAVEEEPLSDQFKVIWECDEELPDDPDDPDDEDGKDGHYCTTDDRHPHAEQLEDAYRDLRPYGATYKNIMIWFCQFNLGFGEIEQAFKLFRLYQDELLLISEDYKIQDIIDLRLSGLGWGQVKQEMARLAKDVLADDEEVSTKKGPDGKKEPPGKDKSEEAKNKEKPNKKKKDD